MSLVRVHNFSVSLDGFGAGEGQRLDAPFGHAGQALMEWAFETRTFRDMGIHGETAGSLGVDDSFASNWAPGIGAEMMGRLPHARRRSHPPRPAHTRDGRRHDLPLRRRRPRLSAREGPRTGWRPRRAHRGAASAPCDSFSRRPPRRRASCTSSPPGARPGRGAISWVPRTRLRPLRLQRTGAPRRSSRRER